MERIDGAISNLWLSFFGWFSDVNYALTLIISEYLYLSIFMAIFFSSLIKLSPLKSHHENSFIEHCMIIVRKIMIWFFCFVALACLTNFIIYSLQGGESFKDWITWFSSITILATPYLIGAFLGAKLLKIIYHRYLVSLFSKLARKFRFQQSDEKITDIRDEATMYEAISFLPTDFYKKDQMAIGLTPTKKPIYTPYSTWIETNMQVIGPTRYGKGVVLGSLMDQVIIKGDTLFYIDPKRDKFAPHIMYQQAIKQGRKFYYLTLHDHGIGKWAPFAGGDYRDALSRIESAFSLEFSGQAGSDFYKSQERKTLERAFKKTRTIEGLKNEIEGQDALRVEAELERWSDIKSLNPKKGTGFSIEKALLENAVVYVQGDLNDSVIKDATKIFISELIQEIRRLSNSRKNHTTIVVDEVSFLVSQTLTKALATIVGFRANFVLAYQSQNDLLNLDDSTVNSKYVYQSININSQLKAVYGGADYETAKWIADASGTIAKQVTRFESTDVNETGGEEWQKHRMIGNVEENLITTNTVLSLDPMVCVFMQPRNLATICCTSFIPVKSHEPLEKYLTKKEIKVTEKAPQENEKKSVKPPRDNFSDDQMELETEPNKPTENPDTTLNMDDMKEILNGGEKSSQAKPQISAPREFLTPEEVAKKEHNKKRRLEQKRKKKEGSTENNTENKNTANQEVTIPLSFMSDIETMELLNDHEEEEGS